MRGVGGGGEGSWSGSSHPEEETGSAPAQGLQPEDEKQPLTVLTLISWPAALRPGRKLSHTSLPALRGEGTAMAAAPLQDNWYLYDTFLVSSASIQFLPYFSKPSRNLGNALQFCRSGVPGREVIYPKGTQFVSSQVRTEIKTFQLQSLFSVLDVKLGLHCPETPAPRISD